MAVAAHAQALVDEAAVAGIGCPLIDDALAEEGQALRGLEGGARRILAHDAAVEQRLPRVEAQLAVALRALAAHHHAGVVAGRAGHAEHLASLRLDGHHGANLTFEQLLGQRLQVLVDGQREVLARHGLAVEGTVLVAALDAPVGIAEQHLHAFLATQLLLVEALHAQLADIVARLVVLVGLHVGRAHLGHVAQHMGGIGVFVAAHAAALHIEAGEAEGFFLEEAEILVGELRHEHLLGVGRVAGILALVAHGGDAGVELLAADVQRLAELQRVEVAAGLVLDDHDVIAGLVVDEQLAVAVGDDATRGKVDFLQEGIGVGVFLVVVAHELQREEADDVDHHDEQRYAGHHKLSVFQSELLLHILVKS